VKFSKAIKTKRRLLRTTGEALRFIDAELPAEFKVQPRWTITRDLLIEAGHSEKSRDLKCAYRQLRQALKNDLLLGDKAG
jgi:hypothetical protein